MRFQPKHIHFGFLVHKLCPKTPKFCWFGAKMGLAHNFTRKDILSYVSTFYGLTTSKQCDLHLQTSFLGACLMFIGQFGYGPGSGPAHANVCVPALSWNISRSRIFPNKLLIQTDREKYRECRKIVIWISHCFWLPCWFSPNFFFHLFKLEIFGNFQKWPSRALNKIIFLAFMCSLGCIWPKKNGFLSVSGHLDLGFSTGPFGPGTGPKSTSTSWYLKG